MLLILPISRDRQKLPACDVEGVRGRTNVIQSLLLDASFAKKFESFQEIFQMGNGDELEMPQHGIL
jgi:hypothetical protein